MQKLELVDDLFPDMLSGVKTRTLRWNEGQIVNGYLLFYATQNPLWKSLVWVKSVQIAPMDKIASFYHMSPLELHQSMLRHYPNIKIDSEVSYIEYLSPAETLVQHGLPSDFEENIIFDIDSAN